MGSAVQRHIKGLQLVAALAGAAQHHLHAGHQLVHGKGFYNVIIRTQPQAQHAVLHGGLGGQKYHRHALGAQVIQQGVAVQAGQHDVQQGQVVVVFLDQISGGQAVGRQVHTYPARVRFISSRRAMGRSSSAISTFVMFIPFPPPV